MRNSPMPVALAASTNGISRNDSTLERMTRATLGISGMAMAMMVLVSDGPSEAVITSAMTSSGSDCMISVEALHDQVEPAADIARGEAEQRRRSRCPAGGAERDGEGDARAVDHAAENVAAHRVGAEQMDAAGRCERQPRRWW